MKRSNLIPITRIYDIYPKYTYSDDVKKFMDEIVDIDRADVYSKDEVIAIIENKLKDLSKRVEAMEKQMKDDKEEQLKELKAELDYAKFRCTL